MRLRRGLVYAVPAVVAGLAVASFAGFAASSAGAPVGQSTLLCGTGSPGTDLNSSGNSSVDHPTGAFAVNSFAYSGSNCTDSQSTGGTIPWTISHSNVNLSKEDTGGMIGTEHGTFVLPSAPAAGFQAHITDFDYNSTTDYTCPDTGGGTQTVYYTSGHNYDACGQPGSVGNFDTHGGANVGAHFWGKYGVVIYQEPMSVTSNSPCQQMANGSPGATYCIEVILEGKIN